jgi:cytoskeletal protein RodZ
VKRGPVTEQPLSSPESGSGSPGTILRRCREFHGITLEEASETTKIGISHLKALEDDQIREFANQAYLKGFLRIYATYLGLNSDDVARMYDKLFGVQGESQEPVRSSVAPSRPPRRFIPLKKLIVPALLLAVILITATFFKQVPPPSVRPAPPQVVTAPPVQSPVVQQAHSSVQAKKPAEPDAVPPKVEKRVEKPADTENVVAPKRPAETPKGFILKIKVTQNGTLSATVDGSAAQQYDLTSGDVIEWKAEKKVTLELSNAGGVDVELNGKPYKQIGSPGKSAYIEFDADGIKQ